MNTMRAAEIEDLLEGADDCRLFAIADEVRKEVFGRDVFLRGVIEFSNHCDNRCLYCGLRKTNDSIERYRLNGSEILDAASKLPELGIGTVVLQSGDDYRYTVEDIGRVIREIKSRYDVAVTLSLGDRKNDDYRYWRDCGADRYLLKLETFDKEIHERLRPGQTLEGRLDRLNFLGSLGYEVGSGIIVGLPGTDTDSLADDILELSRLNLDMIAVGPFVPHPETPLRSDPGGGILTTCRAIAILRIMNHWANIPATSALDAISENGKVKALRCGANILMPSITPETVRRRYNIYPGKNTCFSGAEEEIGAAKSLIHVCKLTPSPLKGFSSRDKS
jgi:biotin synthase